MNYDKSGTSQKSRLPAQLSDRHWRLGDPIFSNLTLFFALVMASLLIGFIIILSTNAWPAIKQFGIHFIFNSTWDPVRELFGALPAIYGTLLCSAIGLLIAVPISFGAAIFLVEMTPSWISGPASFLIEMLAAIPSVIIGLWGLFVLVPHIKPVETWLGHYFGFLPIFKGTVFGGLGFLSAGIILTFMIVPIITAVSRDAIRAVPDTQREAMLALGATRWETILRAVIPYCRSSLVGGVILGLGRALGETMAVTMVIGNSYKLTASLFSPGTTIASKIASEFAEAAEGVPMGSLVELALVLFGITLLVNVIARLLVWRLTSVKAAKE
ncbi:MAG: phosphate ABC transporter permease subunit PstC [Dehalococcoidales bacterium]|jgi:phosphate transport system permease protein